MKISARNAFPRTVSKVELGAVKAELARNIAPGVNVVSITPEDAIGKLGSAVGKRAFTVIKASSVMVGVD